MKKEKLIEQLEKNEKEVKELAKLYAEAEE